MLHKLFVHEELEHGGEAGGGFCFGRGNRSLPWSDEDEWEFASGGLEETGRPLGSKDRRGSGSGSGSGMPDRKEKMRTVLNGF